MKRIKPDAWQPRGVTRLEPAALEAVRDDTNSIVVAGPGAGKTELLAQRASYLLETGLCPAPFRILAISFKRDAARNLRDRVERRCGTELARRFESYTFDAWAKGLLDRFRLALPPNYRPTADYVIDLKFAYEQPLRTRLLSFCEDVGVGTDKVHGADVVKFFREAIAGLAINPVSTPASGTKLALAIALWQSALHSGVRSALAFPMVGVLAELLLRENPPLLKALRNTYRFVFLDEFQDTTGSQYRLLHTGFHGSRAVVTAVGDNKQRIMLWAGAQVGVFDAFTANFVAHRHGLVMNYRSAPRLVAIQHHIIAALDPNSPSPQAADDGTEDEGECRLLQFNDDGREAEYLADLITDWIRSDGLNPMDICILARQQPDIYTAALRTELATRGVACRVQNEFQDLLSEPLTVATIDALRVCVGGRAPENWANLCALTLRLRGCDGSDVEARVIIQSLSTHLSALRPHLLAAATDTAVASIIRGLLAFFDEATFRRLHEQYLQSEFLNQTIEALARYLAYYRGENTNWSVALNAFVGIDCVPVMSIHKSKGLEYHSVVLLGLEDYPFRGIRTGDGEEECNFFVAFSRAKKRVLFTTADRRTNHYGTKAQGRNDVGRFYELLALGGVPTEPIQ
ncbi:MAG: ATP-dependent helicase [Verrucomicrobiota bacterium]